MKRLAFPKSAVLSPLLLVFVLGTLFTVLLSVPTRTNAQGPQSTPIAPTQSSSDVLEQAQKALKQAQDLTDAANNAVTSADNAVNVVNSFLGFIQVAGVLGGVLATVAALVTGSAAVRTILDYRNQLTSAREELEVLKAELKDETEKAQNALATIETRVSAEMAHIGEKMGKTTRALALLEMGEAQFESKNPQAALRTYTEAYELDPENRATNYFLGEIYIMDRDLDKAIAHLQKALAGAENFAPAEAALGYALRLKGERQIDVNERNRYYAQAEQQLLKALSIDPTVRDVNGESFQGVVGGLYQRQGRLEDAIRCYLEAEKVTPNSSYPISNLGLLYFNLGNIEMATHYFDRSIQGSKQALETNPSDYWRRFDIATAEAALSHPDKALEQLDLALKQVQSIGPLESMMNGLTRLEKSPKPPEGITKVTDRVRLAMNKIKEQNKTPPSSMPAVKVETPN